MDKQSEKSLYDRLGGIFAIAAVVNYFSDEIIKDPIAGAQSSNPALREWHTKQLDRLPGLKFMRTLWSPIYRAGRSNIPQRDREVRSSGLKRHIRI